MDFPHPPFVPTATTFPRLLWRWLDINAQGGPLGRVQSYITLPVFNVNYNWLGYSDIVAAFNFEGPNNFSFKGILSEIPINPNYTLCVMWVDADMSTHRYSLWRNPNDVIFFDITPYNGQLIGKNFRFEIWSVDGQAGAVQGNIINFYTSKLGIIDYRYGTDFSLVNADPIVTNFQCINIIPPSPPVVATDYFNASGIVNTGTEYDGWIAAQGTGTTALTGTATVNLDTVKNVSLLEGILQFNFSSNASNLTHIYFIIRANEVNSGVIIKNAVNANVISFTFESIAGIFSLVINGSQHTPAIGGQIIGVGLELNGVNSTITIYNDAGTIFSSIVATTGALISAYAQVALVDGFYELILTNASFNIASYLRHNYGNGFPLPLTFPVGAVPQPNSILN